MSQKFAFYLISTVVVFFIGYSYSQFNTKAPDPVIISLDNSDEIEQYKTDLGNLQVQLDELDSQLISSLDELKSTSKKFTLSSSKVQMLESEIGSLQSTNEQLESELIQSEASTFNSQSEIKLLSEQLSDNLIELELSQFELELANEQSEK